MKLNQELRALARTATADQPWSELATWNLRATAVISNMAQVLSINGKINTVLETAEQILDKSDFNLLHRSSIDPLAFGKIIDNIYLQRKNSTPVFSGSEVSQYYKLGLAHSWAVREDLKIMTLLQIPIAPMTDLNTLAILDPMNQIHPDLNLAVTNLGSNSFRYLSNTDYAACIPVKQTMNCQKRKIDILPEHGCSIRLGNCPVWATTVVHDLTNTEIMLLLPEETEATISCDGSKSVSTNLPMRAILNLDLGCELRADSFQIDRISFRHLASKDSTLDRKVNFKITADISKIAGKLNLHIHNITDENRPDLDNLMRNNKDIKQDLREHMSRSSSLWAKVTGGSTELEQVAVWSLLAFLVLIAGFLLYSYVRLHVRLSRNVQNRRTSEEDEAIELQIRDLKSRVIELESDYQVSAKK